jgi:hypothetical protein
MNRSQRGLANAVPGRNCGFWGEGIDEGERKSGADSA